MTVTKFKNTLDTSVDYRQFLATQQSQHVRKAGEFAEEMHAAIVDGLEETGDPLPWKKSSHKLRLRPGELTIWCGARGHFKSMLSGMVATHLMRTRKVMIASLEMKPVNTLVRMCIQASGKVGPTPHMREQFLKTANEQLWIYDQVGEVDPEAALGVVTYAADHLGCDHIFWDSLMMAGIGHDDYDGQRQFIQTLTDIAKETNKHIHLISHLRKGTSPEYIPNANDIMGSSMIGNLASNIVCVWSNKPKIHARSTGEKVDDNDPDLRLIVDKQRNGEFEGHIGLYFHRPSLQFMETPYVESVMDLM